VQRSFGGNVFSDRRAQQLAQQLAARAFTDYVHGGYDVEPVDASTTVVDVGIRMTQDTMEYIDSIGARFDQMIALCEREVEIIFNNSLQHFGKRVNFRFYWSSVPVEFSSTTSEPHQHNLEASDKLDRDYAFREDHRAGGYDLTLTFVHYGDSFVGKQHDCGGGVASWGWADVNAYPFGVVDIMCLFNDRSDIVAHELAHLFGLGHDIATVESEQLYTSGDHNCNAYGYRQCDPKLGVILHTVMAYRCPGHSTRKPIPHFSCALYEVDGVAIGYLPTATSPGANNCQVLSDNLERVAALSQLHHQLEARSASTY
jgi:Metallo-peptidase family M12B Reprolysin-like